MKVIVIGAGGFIGSYLTKRLTEKYQVLPVYTDTFDVLDQPTVKTILETLKPDCVINCLSFGGYDLSSNSSEYFSKNMTLFWNFFSNQEHFGKYINIGSGIEKVVTPNYNGSYAFSKREISKIIRTSDKFLNYYLYGCFGNHEKDNRLLKRFLASEDTFVIKDDRYFDYISIQDFYKFIEYELDGKREKETTFKEIDCVYDKKMLISDFLTMFCDINNIRKNFVIESTSNINYTGRGPNLNGLHLYGVGHGLKEYMS